MPEPADRRRFFRDSLEAVLRPLAQLINSEGPAPDRAWLRPPGALPEAQFLDTCQRCGDCIKACPATAIRSLVDDDPKRRGTPVIMPDLGACVVCSDLACMPACPTGALSTLADPHDIQMGLARVNHALCTRTHGDDCTACVDLCPLGADAIRLDDAGAVSVVEDGCVGCGVCQFNCPTTPRAIVVEPHLH